MTRKTGYGFGKTGGVGCGLNEGVWPYLFNHTTLGWLYLVKSINGNPFFYDFTIGNYSTAP